MFKIFLTKINPANCIMQAIKSKTIPKKLEKNGNKKPGLTMENIAINAKGKIITMRAESLA